MSRKGTPTDMSASKTSPSAHDVARAAGVSQAAVSRAYTPGASISKTTREKVIKAAEELGYRPNLLARSLIKGTSGLVGVVITNVQGPVVTAALETLSEKLSAADKQILMFTAQESQHADLQVEALLNYRVEAVLLLASSMSIALAQRCRDEGIPVICFNSLLGSSTRFTSITCNNREGASHLADHLYKQGYRHFGLIGGSPTSPTGLEREAGFTDTVASYGLPQPVMEIGNCNREQAMVAARTLLNRDDPPDAIFCSNDHMALAVIEVIRFEFGLRIGTDIGIAGFDNIEQSSWPSFNLTTFTYPMDAMIEKVVEIILAGADPEHPVHRTFSGELVVRGSTQRTNP